MAKKISEYKRDIERALKYAGKYNKSITFQVLSLAGALRTLDLANDDVDRLETTTIIVKNRYGNDAPAPHPAFRIQRETQESVTRQMKALGLTTEALAGADDNDPMVELTQTVAASARRARIVKPLTPDTPTE